MAYFQLSQSNTENGCHQPSGSAFRYQRLTDGEKHKEEVSCIKYYWPIWKPIVTLSVFTFCILLAMCKFANYDPFGLRSAETAKLFSDMEHVFAIFAGCLMMGMVLLAFVMCAAMHCMPCWLSV